MDAYLLKQKLTDKDISNIITKLGGELKSDSESEMIFTSITYRLDANSHKAKLYYYKETKSFVEYHLGMDTFDIYELIKERKRILGEKYNFVDCMKFICKVIGIEYDSSITLVNSSNSFIDSNLKRFTKTNIKRDNVVYDESVLKKFENWYHRDWINDNISIETMKKYNIKYYPFGSQIIIPCYNEQNQLIGIRARNMNPNSSAKYIPYKDLDYKNGDMGWYKFNVGSTFYGLNHTAKNIRRLKKVIICESEKAVLQGDTYFGDDNIVVGMFGSAMTKQKRDLILELGVNEVIIAIDFDYIAESYSDKEAYEEDTDWELYEKKIYKIADMFKGWCKVSAIVDYQPEHKKDCVMDYGKEKMIKLYNERLEIY
jgi:hypothetical protein